MHGPSKRRAFDTLCVNGCAVLTMHGPNKRALLCECHHAGLGGLTELLDRLSASLPPTAASSRVKPVPVHEAPTLMPYNETWQYSAASGNRPQTPKYYTLGALEEAHNLLHM